MTSKELSPEKKYLIRLVQSRFEWLQLTTEQAEYIHNYERNIEGVHVEGSYPSFWEEKEIESHYFREVLDQAQFGKYKAQVDEFLHEHEKGLIEEDQSAGREVADAMSLLEHYRDNVIPRFLEHRGRLTQRFEGNRKLEYLKEEYQIYLKKRWKEICISHFRSARHFQPNKLKVEQLNHEIEKIYPSWYFFGLKADPATKAVATSLLEEMGYAMEKFNKFLDQWSNDAKMKTDANRAESFEPGNKASTFIIDLGGERTEKQKKEDAFLSYLLIDPDRYA